MRNRRDRQARQMALVEEALANGRSVAIDNVNATAADRAPLIAVGRRHGARVVGYALATPAAECLARNRERIGARPRAGGGDPRGGEALRGADDRRGIRRAPSRRCGQRRVRDSPVAGDGAGGPPPTVFLLSPASTSGRRAAMLLRDSAQFPLARALRSPGGAPLGDLFSFCSSLYFRGKLTYARAFGRPPAGLCGAFVITPGEGLRDPAEPVTLARLRRYDEVRIRPARRAISSPCCATRTR